MGLNPNILYDELVLNGEDNSFWGHIPRTYEKVVDFTIDNFSPRKGDHYVSNGKLNILKKFLTEYHSDLGILSPKVEENIELLDKGSILMGQQPIVFGGPGFIGNKFGCLNFLTQETLKKGLELAPIFFIGDYDGLQKELTRTYYPNPISGNPFILHSDDYLSEEQPIASHAAQLPPISWIVDCINHFENNLRGFKKPLKGEKKRIFEERWNHIKTVIRTSFANAKTLSEWAAIIWGTIANIISDLGIVFLPTSHPKVRELIAHEYFPLIKKRAEYSKAFQSSIGKLEELGYQPTLPHRHDNYAPFSLECFEDNTRITTIIEERDGKLFAEGECLGCKKVRSYEVTSLDNLQSISHLIGPRVDTSQVAFQELLNIRIRISGPGEIAYYATVAPSLRHIGFETPLFVKYSRAFYNTNPSEKLGKMLSQRKQPTLHQDDFFSLLRKHYRAKKENPEFVYEIDLEIKAFINEVFQKLEGIKSSMDIQKYVSWQFGRYDKHKFGQEVSWTWMDLAIYTGIADYIQSYTRMYSTSSIVGGYGFINTQI